MTASAPAEPASAFSDPTGPYAAELGAAAQALGVDLPAGARSGLLAYLALLQRWNATYNLTAVREPHAMLRQHLVDCLAVLPPLQAALDGRAAPRVLDVGSGGGLPGVVIAAVCPGVDVTCIDTVGKKAAFVRQVAVELRLRNLHGEHGRVEQWRAAKPFDVVTSRAFASLSDFTTLTRQHLAPGGVWMAMKGVQPDDELAALPTDVAVERIEPLQVPGLDAQRCLVWLRPR